jgi:hypothetical protein
MARQVSLWQPLPLPDLFGRVPARQISLWQPKALRISLRSAFLIFGKRCGQSPDFASKAQVKLRKAPKTTKPPAPKPGGF